LNGLGRTKLFDVSATRKGFASTRDDDGFNCGICIGLGQTVGNAYSVGWSL
jgi:hypothetical protein